MFFKEIDWYKFCPVCVMFVLHLILSAIIVAEISDIAADSVVNRVYYSTKEVDLKDVNFNIHHKYDNEIAQPHSFIRTNQSGLFSPEFQISQDKLSEKIRNKKEYTTLSPLDATTATSFAANQIPGFASTGKTVNFGHCLFKYLRNGDDYDSVKKEDQAKIVDMFNAKRQSTVFNGANQCIRNSPPESMTFIYNKKYFHILFSAINPWELMLFVEILFTTFYFKDVLLNSIEDEKNAYIYVAVVWALFYVTYTICSICHTLQNEGTGSDVVITTMTILSSMYLLYAEYDKRKKKDGEKKEQATDVVHQMDNTPPVVVSDPPPADPLARSDSTTSSTGREGPRAYARRGSQQPSPVPPDQMHQAAEFETRYFFDVRPKHTQQYQSAYRPQSRLYYTDTTYGPKVFMVDGKMDVLKEKLTSMVDLEEIDLRDHYLGNILSMPILVLSVVPIILPNVHLLQCAILFVSVLLYYDVLSTIASKYKQEDGEQIAVYQLVCVLLSAVFFLSASCCILMSQTAMKDFTNITSYATTLSIVIVTMMVLDFVVVVAVHSKWEDGEQKQTVFLYILGFFRSGFVTFLVMYATKKILADPNCCPQQINYTGGY